MKIEGNKTQVVQPAVTAETESPQNKVGDSPVRTNSKENAGATSKLGELFNKAAQFKQGILNKLQAAMDFSKEATVTKTGDKVTIDAGAGDDKIKVSQDAKSGDITVDVNGKTQTFSGKDKDNLVIKAGDGNDTVTVEKGITVMLQLEGGNGNDTITVDKNVTARQKIQGNDGDDVITGGSGDDKIEAGADNDTVDGGDGDDYINGSKGEDKLSGGKGNDVIYGGDDADTIDGGDGDDYLEGSKGNDTISGGKGKDVLSGGIGDDILKGGDGDDVLYAGQGKDKLYGEKGNNRIFSQKDDTDDSKEKGVKNSVVIVELKGNPGGTGVSIVGTDEFKERVEADLEMLRSTPKGREMLQSYDDANNATTVKDASGNITKKGVTVTIKEETSPVNMRTTFDTAGVDPRLKPVYDSKGKITGYNKGDAGDATIYYSTDIMLKVKNADNSIVDFLPSVSLFHEMGHAYDFTHGTLRDGVYTGKDKIDAKNSDLSNAERVATGLKMDIDDDPKTAEKLDSINHPDNLTENALRAEMNRNKREHYKFEDSAKLIRD